MKRKSAFTLIELLVVISIITLLMALLVPAAHRARKQAQAVACQVNLHQWALFFQQYTSDNDGRWFHAHSNSYNPYVWWETVSAGHEDRRRVIDQCPAEPWRKDIAIPLATYTANDWIHDVQTRDTRIMPYFWRHVDAARSPGRVPVALDGVRGWATPFSTDEPPPCKGGCGGGYMADFCVVRHGSFVNGVFMDWSVRRVGLKELWTLKWHRQYDTSGPWTKAGGVLPTDWPQWMRGFTDY